jgi:hypothetical protein
VGKIERIKNQIDKPVELTLVAWGWGIVHLFGYNAHEQGRESEIRIKMRFLICCTISENTK